MMSLVFSPAFSAGLLGETPVTFAPPLPASKLTQVSRVVVVELRRLIELFVFASGDADDADGYRIDADARRGYEFADGRFLAVAPLDRLEPGGFDLEHGDI